MSTSYYDVTSGITWFATDKGLFYSVYGSRVLRFGKSEEEKFGSAYCIARHKDKILIGTDSGVFYLHNESFERWPRGDLESKHVLSIVVESDIIFYRTEFRTKNTGTSHRLYFEQDGVVSPVEFPNFDREISLLSVVSDTDGIDCKPKKRILNKKVIVATNVDIYFFNCQRELEPLYPERSIANISQVVVDTMSPNEMGSGSVGAKIGQGSPRYLLAKQGDRRYRLSFEVYSYENFEGIVSGILAAAIVDGKLWLSKDKKIRIWDAGLGLLTVDDAPEGRDFTQIIQTPNQSVWLVTDDELFRKKAGDRHFTSFVKQTHIESVVQTQNSVWIWGSKGIYTIYENLGVALELNSIRLLPRFELALGTRLRFGARYDLSGRDPVAPDVPRDFRFIIEKERNEFDKRRREGAYYESDLQLTSGVSRIFVAARDSFGNEWNLGVYYFLNLVGFGVFGAIIFIFSLAAASTLAACLLSMAIACCLWMKDFCVSVARHLGDPAFVKKLRPEGAAGRSLKGAVERAPEGVVRRGLKGVGKQSFGLVQWLIETVRFLCIWTAYILFSLLVLCRPEAFRRWLLLSLPMRRLYSFVFRDRYAKMISSKKKRGHEGFTRLCDYYEEENDKILGTIKPGKVRELPGSVYFFECMAYRASRRRENSYKFILPVLVKLEDTSGECQGLIPDAIVRALNRVWALDDSFYLDMLSRHSFLFILTISEAEGELVDAARFFFSNLVLCSKVPNYMIIGRVVMDRITETTD